MGGIIALCVLWLIPAMSMINTYNVAMDEAVEQLSEQILEPETRVRARYCFRTFFDQGRLQLKLMRKQDEGGMPMREGISMDKGLDNSLDEGAPVGVSGDVMLRSY